MRVGVERASRSDSWVWRGHLGVMVGVKRKSSGDSKVWRGRLGVIVVSSTIMNIIYNNFRVYFFPIS